MKPFFAILFIIAAACSGNEKKVPPALHHSKAETTLDNLVDSFKSEYASAGSVTAKDAVVFHYKIKAENYLSDHYLNHMRVHVDSVIVKHWTIDTKFHVSKDLVFASSMQFHKHMPKTEATLFKFMKNLKQGTDTNIDFIYIGKFELHRPEDTLHPALIVNAYPLTYQVHGAR